MQQFLTDLSATFLALPDWLKALWMVIPPAFLLGLAWLAVHFRLQSTRQERVVAGEMIFTVFLDAYGDLRIVRHRPRSFEEAVLEIGELDDD